MLLNSNLSHCSINVFVHFFIFSVSDYLISSSTVGTSNVFVHLNMILVAKYFLVHWTIHVPTVHTMQPRLWPSQQFFLKLTYLGHP
jgi:hypothetical protein